MHKTADYIEQLVASWKLINSLLPDLEGDLVDDVMEHLEDIEILIAPINPAL